MKGMHSHKTLRGRHVQILFLSALLSPMFANTGQTAMAFTLATNRRQLRTTSSSLMPLGASSSVEIRSKSPVELISIDNQHRRKDKRRHDGNPKIEVLKEYDLPTGLRNMVLDHIQYDSSEQILIIDDSGSMRLYDGHLILETIDRVRKARNIERTEFTNSKADGYISRWTESQETSKIITELSAKLGMELQIRFVNSKKRIRVSESRFQNNWKVKRAERGMNSVTPEGGTPLPQTIEKVRNDILQRQGQLRADGKKVTMIICTDGRLNGLSGDQDPFERIEDALLSLRGLPINVVIRLCTDYGPDIDFYNSLDKRLDYLDVIDDWEAEAREVEEHNPWLNYALVLHRMRELGLHGSIKLLDDLDERPLQEDEIRTFVALLFGTTANLLPNPICEWEKFVEEICRLQKGEKKHKNPLTNKCGPWIDVKKLKTHLGLI